MREAYELKEGIDRRSGKRLIGRQEGCSGRPADRRQKRRESVGRCSGRPKVDAQGHRKDGGG